MTYGAPTNLDLSACTVSSDGGETTQTLAQVSAATAQNTSSMASVQQDVSSAQQTAIAASSTATDAKNSISGLDQKYIQIGSYQKPSGPAQYTANGLTYLITPATAGIPQVAIGSPGSSNTVIVKFFAGGGSTDLDNGPDAAWIYRGGSAKTDATVTLNAIALGSEVDGKTSLGTASNRWNGIYSNSGAIQTSDANEKTIVGVLGDSAYAESAKLIAAGQVIRKAITVFTFNGEGTRNHVGAIAQKVEAALTDAGLNAADFGIWCQDVLTQQVAVTNAAGRVTGYKTQPVIDSNGQQVYRQSLRYDELAMLLIAAGEAETRALTARVAALEAKAGA
ncbi:MAG: hypothetical protein ABF443_08250 [Acetobacter malorum]|uniref:hypothetical protein n=1 Tax=Acetobacter malorum TaxID=178901 RepID=UPI0039EA0486